MNTDTRTDNDTMEMIENGIIETYNYRTMEVPCKIIDSTGRVYNVTGLARDVQKNKLTLQVTCKVL
jgi:hypothetical protein